ncbi:hypothetical protein BH24ACT21_BH24ACT21_11660 [soil metagenome]
MPLEVSGDKSDYLVAFARQQEDEVTLTVAPRLYNQLVSSTDALTLETDAWADTRIDVSPLNATNYRNALTHEVISAVEKDAEVFLYVEDLLKSFPVALLVGESEEA